MTDVQQPDPFSKRVRVAEAFRAYKTDTVRLVNPELAGATHIVATRKGIYAVNESNYSLVALGFFFGLTLRGGTIYAFEACDQPHGPTRQGRIVTFEMEGGRIRSTSVIAKGLDNGCHQIDFIDDRLYVVDTYNQQIIRFTEDEMDRETLSPLPVCPAGRWAKDDLAYVHVNSLLMAGDRFLLLLHNGSAHTGRSSEIAVYDRQWQPLERWNLAGSGCHGLAVLEEGELLLCGSDAGELISTTGMRVNVSPFMTRGLSVGEDSVVVGASRFANRDDRMQSSGTITFMDRQYRKQAVLELPGAPMEVRRLDGKDASLSDYLRRRSPRVTLKGGLSLG